MSLGVSDTGNISDDKEWLRRFDLLLRYPDAVGELIDDIEAHAEIERFSLDGYGAVLLRWAHSYPGGTGRLKDLVASRKLILGPHFVSLHELSVSAEMIVRNLQIGMQLGEDLESPGLSARLISGLGHISQLPQLLRLCGLNTVTVLGDIPEQIEKQSFWWRAPDGSTLKADHLDDEAHVGIVPSAQPTKKTKLSPPRRAWAGEISTHETSSQLCSAISWKRGRVSSSLALAERMLLTITEPLCAWWLPSSVEIQTSLSEAWEHLLKQASGDPQAAQADQKAMEIARKHASSALRSAQTATSHRGFLIINPLSRQMNGLVEVLLSSQIPTERLIRAGLQPTSASETDASSHRRVLVRAAAVPPFGWAPLHLTSLDVAPVSADANRLNNGFVDLKVDPMSGTFTLNGHQGLDRIVEEGDVGDELAFRPQDTAVVDKPSGVVIDVLERGPLLGRLRIRRLFPWPTKTSVQHRTEVTNVEVTTVLELRAGESFVRVATSFTDPCIGHRIRTLMPLPRSAKTSVTSCAFGQSVSKSENGSEKPLLGMLYVDAGGLTLWHDGAFEYELTDEGKTLALTLTRTSGSIREDLTPSTFFYSISESSSEDHPSVEELAAMSDVVFGSLMCVTSQGIGDLPESGSHLDLSGATVSALRQDGDELELRVFNPTSEPTIVELGTPGSVVDLRGQHLGQFDRSFPLAAQGIATVRLGKH